jgi:hypothetical protein
MKTILNVISVLIFVVWVLPWTNEAGTQKALRYSGFSDVRTRGHSFFTCMSDWSATEFEATNPAGLPRVTGTVCCGLVVKACTVRW